MSNWETIACSQTLNSISSVYSYPTHHYSLVRDDLPRNDGMIKWTIEMECPCKPNFLKYSTELVQKSLSGDVKRVIIGCNECGREVFRIVIELSSLRMERLV